MLEPDGQLWRGAMGLRATRRRIGTGGGALAAAGLLAAACGAPGDGGSASAPPASPPVTVTYMGPLNTADRLALERALFDSFNQSRRDVSVEVAAGPGGWNQLREKLIVSDAAGSPLDMVVNGWGTWTDLAQGGVL